MKLRLAISHQILIAAKRTQLTWFALEVSITCRTLLKTLRLNATIWTFAIFEVRFSTTLTKSRRFSDISALSADLGPLPAF